ncbi:hypothetical protein BN3661_00041 [Eubacteriaceae bacterium CHKCI005]|nr:hypothetical protein BN3661_00041 [Eubacteriaceae bacterium CHKCI005]
MMERLKATCSRTILQNRFDVRYMTNPPLGLMTWPVMNLA